MIACKSCADIVGRSVEVGDDFDLPYVIVFLVPFFDLILYTYLCTKRFEL